LPLVIIGLGNPGPEYEATRHNAGKRLLDYLSQKFTIPLDRKQADFQFGEGVWRDRRLLLVFPTAFMNMSGKVVPWLRMKGAGDPAQWLLLHDDLDTPFGMVRFREKGGAGGQRGVESILNSAGSKNIARIKVGIGRPPYVGADVSGYVLSPFLKEERERLPFLFENALALTEKWLLSRERN